MRARIRSELPVIALFAAALAAVGAPRRARAPPGGPLAWRTRRQHRRRPPGLAWAWCPGCVSAGLRRPELPGAQRVPKPGVFSVLNGVYCVSAADCWAVGEYRTSHQGGRNEVLHWKGKTWQTLTVPNPGGHAVSSASELFGVRCASARDCWAVGDYTSHGADLNEVLHWNGTRWSKVTTPSAGRDHAGQPE